MKSWKKLLALLLALAMVFALAACNSKDDDGDDDKKTSEPSSQGEPKPEPEPEPEPEVIDITGKWSVEFDYTPIINDQMAAEGSDVALESKFPFYLIYEVDEKECSMSLMINKDDLSDFTTEYIDLIAESNYATGEAQGMSRAEVDALMEQSFGMDTMAYAEATAEQIIDSIIELFDSAKFDAYYKIEGEKIYMDEEKDNLEDVDDAAATMKFELENDKLTVTKVTGTIEVNIDELLDYDSTDVPWVFEKQ